LVGDELVTKFDDFGGDHVTVELLAHLAGKLLDLFTLFIVTKSNGRSLGTSTSSSTDTMEVAFGLIGEREVDDCTDSGDIKSSSHKVSCQEVINLTLLKPINSFRSLSHGHVTMHLSGTQAEYCEQRVGSFAKNFLIVEDDSSFVETLHAQAEEGGFSSDEMLIHDVVISELRLGLLLTFFTLSGGVRAKGRA